MSVMAASHETILQLPVEETVKQSITGVIHLRSDACSSQFLISQQMDCIAMPGHSLIISGT